MLEILSLALLLLLCNVDADVPNSNNTVFINPSNTSSDPIVWELGTTQVIQWNTTASPLSLDLYQFMPETKNYESAYIFYDFANITEYAWTVDTIEPLNSTGEGSFHLKLVPPNYDGLPGEGLDGIGFIIKNSSISNSSISSSPSSSTASITFSTTSPTLSTAIGQATTPVPSPDAHIGSSSGLSPSAKKGLGIGLGLGLTTLILLNAFAICWYVRRHKRRPSVQPKDTRPMYTQPVQNVPWTQRQAFVEAADTSRGEVADTSRSEMDGIGGRVELSAGKT